RVEVDAAQAGSLTVDLMYVAPGASWRPAYRASLDAATGEVTLTSEAVVRQTSGEDWNGVELSLSTAAPARGVQPPELPPWLLRPVEISNKMVQGMPVIGKNYQSTLKMAPGVTDRAAALQSEGAAGFVEAEQQSAAVVHSAYNVAFDVPGKSDVPADGRDHRVGLRTESLKGEVSYRAVPALNEAAFLVSKTKAPADYPLLAGPVRVFAGGAFLGSFPLDETGPGAEVTLPFGVDNRIKVERTPLPQSREEKGIIGKDRVITFGFRTTVENLRDKAVHLTLEDRIPVPEDERIKVEVGRETTAGYNEVKDRPGILEWDLDLDPGAKREVTLQYTVRFPQDLVVPGM
ncbi:MAG TPA: DUF4139 domain-containing protein, partial [Candidatus Saccharimonadales bacterium]|nr:DUF4139 domain-containing protein [Candidatus Saccharimonadales bacterium]